MYIFFGPFWLKFLRYIAVGNRDGKRGEKEETDRHLKITIHYNDTVAFKPNTFTHLLNTHTHTHKFFFLSLFIMAQRLPESKFVMITWMRY